MLAFDWEKKCCSFALSKLHFGPCNLPLLFIQAVSKLSSAHHIHWRQFATCAVSITLKTYANFCDSSLYLHHYSTSLPSSLPLWHLPPHSPPPPRSPDPPPSVNTSELEVWQILVTQMPRMMRIHASLSLLLLLSRNT